MFYLNKRPLCNKYLKMCFERKEKGNVSMMFKTLYSQKPANTKP